MSCSFNQSFIAQLQIAARATTPSYTVRAGMCCCYAACFLCHFHPSRGPRPQPCAALPTERDHQERASTHTHCLKSPSHTRILVSKLKWSNLSSFFFLHNDFPVHVHVHALHPSYALTRKERLQSHPFKVFQLAEQPLPQADPTR